MWPPHGRNTTASTHIPSSGHGLIEKCDDGLRSTHAEFRVLLAARDTRRGSTSWASSGSSPVA